MLPLILVVAAFFGSTAFTSGAEVPPIKPNVIFILADDLGIGNVSCYGADHYRTPNIDKLAAGGTRFTHFYTAPLCGPSRALIMTGRYAFRTGATNQDATGRMTPDHETFMPSYLKSAGYVTSCIGKWGQLPLGPAEFGFDDWMKFRGSGVYWSTPKQPEKYWVNGQEKLLQEGEYMPDLMHAHLVDFIAQHRAEPFYVYYSMSHVHGELMRTPDSAPEPADLLADNCAYMDKLVGKLVDELERLKLRERTLLVFMGDNGTGQKWADHSTIGGRRLSGQKGSMLECGALVPFIANWPGVTPAGKVCADFFDASDLVPTFAELVGTRLPPEKGLDGRSFASQLQGHAGTPRDTVFMQLAREWWVRSDGWKLNQSGQLFDMSGAPFGEKLVPPAGESDASKAARTHLTAALAALNPGGGVLDTGDGTGRHAAKHQPHASAPTPANAPTAAPTTAAPPRPSREPQAERAARFDRLDPEHKGKLTLEEYVAHQSDPAGARKRFEKFDANHDGSVTRDEFIQNGATKPK